MRDLADNWLSAFKLIVILVILLWAIEIANFLLGHRLNAFGIYPRRVDSLPGILFWPLLHGGFYHLVMNTTPLFVMGFFVALRGKWVFLQSSLPILVVGGSGVWVFGRAAFHVGASGIGFGLLAFVFW